MSGRSARLGGVAGDVVVVGVWFVVLAVVGGVAWWQLAPDVLATSSEAGVVVQGPQLERQVGVDGWYAALGLVGGLLSGVVLSWWRRERPVLVVGLVTVGAALAGLGASHLGLLLGPGDPRPRLEDASPGTTGALELMVQATGALWLWPLAAVAGALGYLVVRGPEVHDPQVHGETAASEVPAR